MEKMVLEQYLKVLYPEVKAWVKERDPSTAADAARLVDTYVAAHKGPGTYQYAGQLRPHGGKSKGLGKGGGSGNYTQGQGSFRKPLVVEQTNPKTWTGHKAEVVCHNCGEAGHSHPFCPI